MYPTLFDIEMLTLTILQSFVTTCYIISVSYIYTADPIHYVD